MFGIGFGEIVIILVLALVLLGPQKLPDVAKQLGKAMREFRRATDDLKQQFETELYNQPEKPASRPSLTQAPRAAEGTIPADPAPAAQSENAAPLEAAAAESGVKPAEPEKPT